jgi:hypothetical protein
MMDENFTATRSASKHRYSHTIFTKVKISVPHILTDKLFLYLTKPYYRDRQGSEILVHMFLTLALGGSEWSASQPCHFTPRERTVPLKQEAGRAAELVCML